MWVFLFFTISLLNSGNTVNTGFLLFDFICFLQPQRIQQLEDQLEDQLTESDPSDGFGLVELPSHKTVPSAETQFLSSYFKSAKRMSE